MHTTLRLSLIILSLSFAASAHAGDQEDCAVAQLRASKSYAACSFRAQQRAAKNGGAVDDTRCQDRLARAFASAEEHCSGLGQELTENDVGDAIALMAAAIGDAARDGSGLDLQGFCGPDTTWDPSTLTCVTQGDVPSSSLSPGLSSFSLPQQVDGVVVDRRFQIHAPSSLTAGKTYPVLFAFHGNGGRGDQFAGQLAQWVNAGEFIGVYPDGLENSWNLGPEASNADDVEFVEAIVGELMQYAELDTDRMFAMGGSNGAGMVHRLAVQTDLFRGIGTIVTSLLADGLPAPGSKSVRVLQILGTDDHLIPYEGGIGVLGHEFLGAEESAATWAAANSCNVPGDRTTTADGNVKIEFSGCVDQVEVVHYGIVGAGHGLPRDAEGGIEALIVDFFFGDQG